MPALVTDYQSFKDHSDKTLYFVRHSNKTGKILCWEGGELFGNHEEHCRVIPANSVPIDQLKALEIWDSFSPKMQKELVNSESVEREKVHEKMANARRGRRNKYPDIPRELTCTTCSVVIVTPPSVLAKRIEKSGKTIEEFVKAFQCQQCNPTKGRKADPKYAHLPKEMELTCKSCSFKKMIPRSQAITRAKSKGMEVDKWLKSYQCQTCNPTKGRKKGSKNKKGKKK